MKFKVGDKYEVVGQNNDHHKHFFSFGSVVEFTGEYSSETGRPCFRNDRGLEQFLQESCVEPHRASTKKTPFAKSDLKDGMTCETGSGLVYYVCGTVLRNKRYLTTYAYLSYYDDNLRYTEDQDGTDIIRVTDRDGTVVFEREPEKKKVTLELTDEQIESLKQQGIFKEK